MTGEVLAELLDAARAHRERCLARYGPDSYQVRSAERAVATISKGSLI